MTTYFLERLCASEAAAPRLRVRRASAPETVVAAAVSRAREEAEVATATAAVALQAAATAVAKADALEMLERKMTDAGEGSSSGAAGPSEASESVVVPDASPGVPPPVELPPAGWHASPAVPPREQPGDYHGD